MVSDNRGRTDFRVCPTVDNEEDRPLFEQHITEDTCHKRQGRSYHKCHRCVFQEFARQRDDYARIPVW